MPRVLTTVELRVQFFEHLRFGILVVEMREVNQSLAHNLVLHQDVVILQSFSHDVPIFILYDQNLLRFGHARDHQQAQFAKRRGVQHSTVYASLVLSDDISAESEVPGIAALGLEHIAHHEVPVIEANLEHFRFVHVRNVQKILDADEHRLLQLGGRFQEHDVSFEKLSEEDAQVLHKRLLVIRTVGVRLGDVHAARQDAQQVFHGDGVELDEVRVVFRLDVQTTNLRQTEECDVAIRRIGREREQGVQQRRLEDVTERYPRQERVERRERRLYQLWFLRMRQDKLAQLVNHLELAVQRSLQRSNFVLRHLPSTEIENFLRQQFQDAHAVFAQRLARPRRAHQIRNETLPAMRPIVF